MADKSKDTGTGGINIDGDLYSADVGVSDIEGGNQGKKWSPGDVAVDKSVKDISKPTRETFAKYMSRTTLATAGAATHANVYALDAEVVLPLSTHNNGIPVSPAQSPNAAKFAPAFDTQMGVPAPLLIKKGIASGNNPDGNQLLPGAAEPANSGAPYIKPAKELNDPIKSYTENELDPNLYSPLDDPLTPNVVIGDGGQIAADNIRPLHVTTGLATDGGASTGIFTPNENHTLTPEKAAKKAKTETENNFYPVVVAETVSFVKPSAKDVLADPSDANKFADVKIGSSPFISKGKLVNNAADNTNLPNGNTLLPSAATLADSGDDYVKFVILSADGKKGLQDPVKSYTNNTIVKNLNNYNTPPVVISAGGLNVSPSSLRDIKIVSNFADDAGTSKNILGPDGNQGLHALSLIKAENLANVTTSAASDGTKNKYAVDATADPSKASTVTLRGADGHPISVTAAQNNPTNSSFFSSKIQTSYTTAYVTAIADPTPFLIKRGKESGAAAAAKDGNELLPGVSSTLPAGLQTYTSAVLKPNLETAYDPRVLPSSGADPAGADIGSTSGIKSLHNPSSFPVDGGNSANVLSDASSKSLNQLATVVHDKTADNVYPVDSPVVAGKLTMFSLDSSVVLADPSNDKKFADVKIGSSPFISKGKLVNKDADNKNLPNGNTLLPSAATLADPGAPYIKPAKKLNDTINSYTKSALDPNLYSPLDNPLTPNVVIGDGGQVTADNIRPLHVTTGLATDGGNSANVLSDASSKSLNQLATVVHDKTADNVYPVDSPVVAGKLTMFSLDSSVVLADPSNDKKFADIKIGVSDSYAGVEVNSKGKLVKKDSTNNPLPDGNTLLPSAATLADPGTPYIKPAKALNSPIVAYTAAIFGKNLYKPDDTTNDDKSIVENAKTQNEDFFGPKNLYKPDPGPVDLGTFDNIAKDPDSKTITKETLFSYFKSQVDGTVNPGNKNVYAPKEPQALFSITKDGKSASPTTAQDSEKDKGMYAPGAVPSSYSDSLKSSTISRGKSFANDPVARDGNTLLKDAFPKAPSNQNAPYIKDSGNPPDGPVTKYVSAVLKNNRFNPGDSSSGFLYTPTNTPGDVPKSEYLEAHDINEKLKSNSTYSNQYAMGRYSPTDARGYNMDRLAQIAPLLQLRATGERGTDNGIGADGKGTIDTTDFPNLSTLLPGLGQLGVLSQTDKFSLSAKDAIASLKEQPFAHNVNYIDPTSKSEGVINSMFEKFSGFSSLGMVALAIALVVAVGVALSVVSLAFNGITNIPNTGIEYSPTHRPYLGSYQGHGSSMSNDDILSIFMPSPPIPGAGASTGNKFLRFFGLPNTTKNFFTAVLDGLLLFFGLAQASLAGSAVVGGFKAASKLFQNPGYYVVTCRTVVRSAVQLLAAFEDLTKITTPTAGVETVLELVGILKHSRFFAAMGIFALMGDRFASPEKMLLDKQLIPDTEALGFEGDAGRKFSVIDRYDDYIPAVNYTKSRLRGDMPKAAEKTVGFEMNQWGTKKLAWSVNRTPDLLMLHKNSFLLSNFSTDMGGGRLITLDPLQRTRFELIDDSADAPRLDGRIRGRIEKDFDSEYLPFYFHDLRTNEIVGFHAFLASLTDDYTANYDSTDAFGRVEPIRVYKSTGRKISLSFIVAALDEKDFDSMWLKINKLTTLVYPQYTAGRQVQLGQIDNGSSPYTFTKPFTQMIGAPPMIRLRVGNVVASNYSKFNLAGIFGMTQKGATVASKTAAATPASPSASSPPAVGAPAPAPTVTTDASSPNAPVKAPAPMRLTFPKDHVLQLMEKLQIPSEDSQWELATSATPLSVNPIEDWPVSQPPTDGAPTPEPPPPEQQIFIIKNYNCFLFKPSAGAQLGDSVIKGKLVKSNYPGHKDAQVRYDQAVSSNQTFSVEGIEFTVVRDALINLSETTTQRIIDDASAGLLADAAAANPVLEFVASLKDFMLPDNNSIVRSFESTGGRGLAGFIDSMNFDWYNGVTWDISTDRKAPKMCKVTINFTPIHDISPGLDSNGQNRAPIYRLGPYRESLSK